MTRSWRRLTKSAPHSRLVLALVAAFTLVFLVTRVGAQQSAANQLLARVNGERIAIGLPPLASSSELAAAAQRYSDDIAARRAVGHEGSDGSTPLERMAAAGYAGFSSGIVGLEIVYAGALSDQTLDWWMDSPDSLEAALSAIFREIGIGFTQGADGLAYWALLFGARPNVLPIFINNGAVQTSNPLVTLTLSNEGAMLNGDGDNVIGLAREIRVSNLEEGAEVDWEPWTAAITWTLSSGEGVKTVQVEFRDLVGPQRCQPGGDHSDAGRRIPHDFAGRNPGALPRRTIGPWLNAGRYPNR